MKQILTLIFTFFIFANFTFANDVNKSLNNEQISGINKNLNQDINLTKQFNELSKAINSNDYKKVKNILDKNPQLMDLKNNENMKLVHLEVVNSENATNEILKLILSYEKELDVYYGIAMFVPIKTHFGDTAGVEISKMLFSIHSDLPNEIDETFKEKYAFSVLFIIYLQNNFELFKLYLESGFKISNEDSTINDISHDMLKFIQEDKGYKLDVHFIPSETKKFLQSSEYQTYKKEKLKWIKEILKYKKISEFRKFNIGFLYILFDVTQDDEIKQLLDGGK
ncbi:hypothetical protein CBLAS_0356 [Campylobacter blaseri]|uniref:Uncharacterized protein n=1 Tax=Campylobacter blaseri TaxID=2042961 RepID=A0A2P8R1I3_9BACT|nr:hypothetical protein [Campylobacter blaseri]PSM52353.1 hypothetical protein CQ405_04690 [Campylobacter blaseri]PSM54119.1 hypothetical protein CRN67_04690 [Campylobacter blaseri]QKF85563.1 hypothetical protein CBLAS_0356 [Campylobacter blaseri]